MKSLKDYTTKELVELSELVKLECADRGVAINVDKPLEPEPIKHIKGTLIISEFPSFACDRHTEDKIIKLLTEGCVYNQPYGKPYYVEIVDTTDYNYPTPKQLIGCTPEQFFLMVSTLNH